MVRTYRFKEGDNMLADNKIKIKVEGAPKSAKKTDVAKAISKSNKKHSKMMKMLAE